jgi:serine/threonine-protein kinase RsbW
MNKLKIDIPSIPDNIRIVESFVDNAKEKFEINDDMYGNIMVSLTESVNNAILHGNNSDESKKVKLTLEIIENELIFTVEDEGEGFNYDKLPDPTSPENLEKIGGRGIFLMKHLCDEVRFENNGAKVKLHFIVE